MALCLPHGCNGIKKKKAGKLSQGHMQLFFFAYLLPFCFAFCLLRTACLKAKLEQGDSSRLSPLSYMHMPLMLMVGRDYVQLCLHRALCDSFY